jgi:hypothetical protein
MFTLPNQQKHTCLEETVIKSQKEKKQNIGRRVLNGRQCR